MSGTAGMMPELGSKISLISKADIRYEGRLFTVDPQECTIALANVRSFGTEDRETPYPIAPQPTVYDYILFRGSDIKDIRVVNNVAIPNDPAIMQMHLPPNQMSQPGFPPQNFPMQQPVPSMGNVGFGQFAQMQGPPGQPGPNVPQQPPPQQQQQQHQSSPSQAQQQQQQNQSNQQGNTTNNLTPTGQAKKSNSRSGTPNLSRKSPTSDMGVQTSAGNKENVQKNNIQRNQQNRNQNNQQQRPQQQQQQQHQHQRGGYNMRNNRGNHQMRGNQGGSGRMRPPPQNQQYYRQNQNKQQQNGGPPRGNKNQNTLKFENEFDFEQANSKFEELRSQLAKLKVGSEENKNTEQVNGEVEKKDDSGNETAADHEAENDDVIGYDKNKSFFDNISCEANERSKGKPQRPDWRQERKINSETFGYSMNRRGGNMRGRGYYRNSYGNRPMNNYRSGGVPQQFRNRNRNPQNNNSGRNNNQGQQSQNQTPVAAAN